MTTVIHGWGRYPRCNAEVFLPRSFRECMECVAAPGTLITRGLGRSYGDSAIAARVLASRFLDHFLGFDPPTGLLHCSAGVPLAEVLRVFVPRGWFLAVTPGTQFVTVGGAIASDVHGKNHHRDGTFCQHVQSLTLLTGNGTQLVASATENAELFYATCGGMGLTGIILSAVIQLKPIQSSDMIETTLKTSCLDALLEAFEESADSSYSVAWIDCLATGKNLGRSLLVLGEHAEDGGFRLQSGRNVAVPLEMPASPLNYTSVKLFNTLYYGKVRGARKPHRIPFETFFYPLDQISHWNRLYGRRGFVQYQAVLPKRGGSTVLKKMLQRISASGKASFLAVLKVFGAANKNHLSFPLEGYTLALDFKVEPEIFALLDELDQVVLDYGGRLYLAKDARMHEATFKACFPRWEEFEEVRAKYNAIGKFASNQSRRLGLQ